MAPPSEWPMIQMLLSGYMYVRLLYRFCARRAKLNEAAGGHGGGRTVAIG